MLERKFHQRGPCGGLRLLFGRTSIPEMRSTGSWQQRAICSHRRKLRCHTYYHLVGLLATTGMRSGEAVRLANSDVNLARRTDNNPGEQVRQIAHRPASSHDR